MEWGNAIRGVQEKAHVMSCQVYATESVDTQKRSPAPKAKIIIIIKMYTGLMA